VEKEGDEGKTLKSLGSLAATSMIAKRVIDCEVIATNKVDATSLSHFYQGWYLKNYAYSEKSHIGAEEDFTGDQNDSRKHRHVREVDEIVISHEALDRASENFEFKLKLAATRATFYARALANIRATEADCEFMEGKVAELIHGKPNVHLEVIKGEALRKIGMNLFYEVGKCA